MLAAAMMATLLQQLPPPPPPPSIVFGDYMPGPWFVPIDIRTGRPLAETADVIDGIADAAHRLPHARLVLCATPAAGTTSSLRDMRRWVSRTRALLAGKGVVAMAAGRASDCSSIGEPHSVPGLVILIGPAAE